MYLKYRSQKCMFSSSNIMDIHSIENKVALFFTLELHSKEYFLSIQVSLYIFIIVIDNTKIFSEYQNLF